jgi:hypothetical protein
MHGTDSNWLNDAFEVEEICENDGMDFMKPVLIHAESAIKIKT